jgi:hypothetical protein
MGRCAGKKISFMEHLTKKKLSSRKRNNGSSKNTFEFVLERSDNSADSPIFTAHDVFSIVI